MNTFPEKWALKHTIENKELLNQFIKNNSSHWKNWTKSWEVNIDEEPGYLHFPKCDEDTHSTYFIKEGYTEINTEMFKQNVLNINVNYEIY